MAGDRFSSEGHLLAGFSVDFWEVLYFPVRSIRRHFHHIQAFMDIPAIPFIGDARTAKKNNGLFRYPGKERWEGDS